MKKADYVFHRSKKQAVQSASAENEPFFWDYGRPSNMPIFIPKRKKRK